MAAPKKKTRATSAAKKRGPTKKHKVKSTKAKGKVARPGAARSRKRKVATGKKKVATGKKKVAAGKKKVAAGKKRRARPGKPGRKTLVRAAARATSVRRGAKAKRKAPTEVRDRITPLVDSETAEELDEFGGPIRPSRVITTRPRPPLRQVDPLGPSVGTSASGQAGDGLDELEPWDLDVAEVPARAAPQPPDDVATTGTFRPVGSTTSVAKKAEEARRAGWVDDPRPAGTGLADARVRFTHPACKYLDGKLVRDVSLSLHGPTGRAALLLEGGDRIRVVSWLMTEEEELPSQIGRILGDPARVSRVEHSSGRELLGHLDDLDRSAVEALRSVATAKSDEPIYGRLLEYVRGFASLNASFGLPSTVDAIWDRFGVRKSCVLERLGLDESVRKRISDLFDDAIDNA